MNTPVAKATSLFRKRNRKPLAAPSVEGAKGRFRLCGGEAVAFRSPPPPLRAPAYRLYCTKRWQGAAALSAAVTTTALQEPTPNPQAEPTPQKQPPQTPATLRERGSGGEALLLEKRPLPRNLPTQHLFGREREGGCFSIRKAPSLAYSHSSKGILERSAVMSSSSGSGRTP